ncbi:MAG: signal peptidase II [Anaerolineales bacterium]
MESEKKENVSLKKYITLTALVGSIVALDQWTKWLVRTNIPLNTSWLPDSLLWLSPYARILHIFNKGAAFGMFQSGNPIFTVLALLVVLGILYYYSQIEEGDKLLQVAAGLYLGGVLGNLIDRLTLGQVTDFISVGTFYIFNVADASINVGVVVLLFGIWMKEYQGKKQNSESHSTDETLPTNGNQS